MIHRLVTAYKVFRHGITAGDEVVIKARAEFDISAGGLTIGHRSKILEYVYIHISHALVGTPHIFIGADSAISRYSILACKERITIGRGVLIGPHVQIIDHDHGHTVGVPMREQIDWTAPITIGDDVWIGGGAKILKGVTIGNGAVIGANAVVCGDVEVNAIVGGIPAKCLKYRQAPHQQAHDEYAKTYFFCPSCRLAFVQRWQYPQNVQCYHCGTDFATTLDVQEIVLTKTEACI